MWMQEEKWWNKLLLSPWNYMQGYHTTNSYFWDIDTENKISSASFLAAFFCFGYVTITDNLVMKKLVYLKELICLIILFPPPGWHIILHQGLIFFTRVSFSLPGPTFNSMTAAGQTRQIQKSLSSPNPPNPQKKKNEGENQSQSNTVPLTIIFPFREHGGWSTPGSIKTREQMGGVKCQRWEDFELSFLWLKWREVYSVSILLASEGIIKPYNFLGKLKKKHISRIAYRPPDTTRVTATLNICGERIPLM